MRNKNIFLRKETAYSVVERRGDVFPTFALVIGHHLTDDIDMVHYKVDFIEPMRVGKGKTKPHWRWHYASRNLDYFVDEDDTGLDPSEDRVSIPYRSGTYILPLEKFLERFTLDVNDVYSEYV